MATQVEITGNNPEGSYDTAEVDSRNALKVNVEEHFLTFTQNYTGAQTNLVIITPPSGQKVHVCSVYVNTATTNVDVDIHFTTSGRYALYLHTAAQTRDAMSPVHVDGNVGETLQLSCGANTFVAICYYFHS